VTGSLPIAPMTGSSLWHWRKTAALAIWGACFALYVGYAVGFVTDTHVAVLGVAALPVFALTLADFAVSRRATKPLWARAIGRTVGFLATGVALLAPIPGPVAANVSASWDRAQANAAAALRRALAALLHPGRHRAA
jgi:hypothetical protein